MKKNSSISVNGYLSVGDRDKSGNILQIVVDSDEFITYIIETDQIARQMFPLIRKKVFLKGIIIGENERCNPVMRVSTYKVLS